ncbi:DNA polymerase III subunit delta' [Alkalicaulis satelles]|uniref:DNA polymerase III subunit delta n=1 Tax=Alkalicaulis satelles TaxID=2609175 RepID=A0A5M6ZM61_9PROT|nr:DNA polymerase III subunit delta' [Alkalicaulis satelles]KAA5804777.1 DNA polymerase III subunit delta' [Alkalicaulis satelles]
MSETPEADREGELAHPRTVYELFGHTRAAAAMEDAFTRGRMHHAWMITGPKGVGKATLAWRLARRVMGAPAAGPEPLSADPAHPACRRIEALSGADLLLIRRPFNDKTGKLKGEIPVDETRRVSEFFSKSAGEGGWRVAIVDSADDLNPNSANALLKTLEEPPRRGLLLLIVNAPGRVLPTIRSRCRQLALRAPSPDETARWLTQTHGVEAGAAQRASALADGAPGRALALAATDAPGLKDVIDAALSRLPELDASAARRLADSVARKDAEGLREVLMGFLISYARERARDAALAGPGGAEPWIEAAGQLARLASDTENLYLDPRQSIHYALGLMRTAAAS